MSSTLLRKERSEPRDRVKNGKVDANGNYLGRNVPDLEEHLINSDAYNGMTHYSDLNGMVEEYDPAFMHSGGVKSNQKHSVKKHMKDTKKYAEKLGEHKDDILDISHMLLYEPEDGEMPEMPEKTGGNISIKGKVPSWNLMGQQYSSGDPRSYMPDTKAKGGMYIGGDTIGGAWYDDLWSGIKDAGKWVYDNRDTIIPIAKEVIKLAAGKYHHQELRENKHLLKEHLHEALSQGAGRYFFTHREVRKFDDELLKEYYEYLKKVILEKMERKKGTKILAKSLQTLKDKEIDSEGLRKHSGLKKDARLLNLRKSEASHWKEEFEKKKKLYSNEEGDEDYVRAPRRKKAPEKTLNINDMININDVRGTGGSISKIGHYLNLGVGVLKKLYYLQKKLRRDLAEVEALEAKLEKNNPPKVEQKLQEQLQNKVEEVIVLETEIKDVKKNMVNVNQKFNINDKVKVGAGRNKLGQYVKGGSFSNKFSDTLKAPLRIPKKYQEIGVPEFNSSEDEDEYSEAEEYTTKKGYGASPLPYDGSQARNRLRQRLSSTYTPAFDNRVFSKKINSHNPLRGSAKKIGSYTM